MIRCVRLWTGEDGSSHFEEGAIDITAGTELVGVADRSLVALLGASPGASTAAFIAIEVLQKCFAGELTAQAWLPKLKEMIPSYGISLIDDADFTRKIRTETARALKVDDVSSAHKATPSPVRTAVTS